MHEIFYAFNVHLIFCRVANIKCADIFSAKKNMRKFPDLWYNHSIITVHGHLM